MDGKTVVRLCPTVLSESSVQVIARRNTQTVAVSACIMANWLVPTLPGAVGA